MIQKSSYTTQEIAEIFGVSRVAVFKWIKSGKIIASKMGRNYMVSASALSGVLANYSKKESGMKIAKTLGLTVPLGLIAIPVYGTADCGDATRFAENYVQKNIRVSGALVQYKKGLFAVQADGFSMNRAKIGKSKRSIDPGDYVIVDADVKTPENGEYVLSVIDGLANIKKFYLDQEHQQVMLVSESTKDYPPIVIGESEIGQYVLSGKVVEVIKHVKN